MRGHYYEDHEADDGPYNAVSVLRALQEELAFEGREVTSTCLAMAIECLKKADDQSR